MASGIPVVLLHGNGMIEDYVSSGLRGRTAMSHRVIAFDRPGFGYSERPRGRAWRPSEQASLLVRAFAKLGIERPIVVGHSWGTLVAIAMALGHPEDVAGLVLLSGYYYPKPRWDAAVLASSALPVVGDFLRHTVVPLIGRLMAPGANKRVFAPHTVPARFEEKYSVPLCS
jgi:pimeloyl-ACP methyl ester carboxylesterase